MFNVLNSLPVPFVKMRNARKSKVRSKLFDGLILYNKFFIKVKGDYYVPLYTLPNFINTSKGDYDDWAKIKKYIQQKYRQYIESNYSDIIILFSSSFLGKPP